MTAYDALEHAYRTDLRVVSGPAPSPDIGSDDNLLSLPVLQSSFRPAPLPDVVVWRQRLIDQLTNCVHKRAVTVIDAPAGTGKSVLAATWHTRRDEHWPVAWFTASMHTGTCVSFWRHVVRSVAEAGIPLERTARAAPPTSFDASFFVRFAADLLDASQPLVLVVDDFDLVTNQAVLDGLDFLGRHAYPKFRLVLCARSEPRLPIQRYRLADSLAKIGVGDLAFTVTETHELLAASGVAASTDLAEDVVRRTGGWAVGLRLTTISLQRWALPTVAASSPAPEDRSSEPEPARAESEEAVADYLRREVIEPLPAYLRNVLGQICVADDLPPDLVATLTGVPDGVRLLGDLARRGAFIERTNQVGVGYRLHPAMRAVLRAQLRRDAPESANDLHRACAKWSVANDQPIAAMRHAAATGTWREICELLVQDLRVVPMIYPAACGPRESAEAFASLPADVPGAAAAVVRAALAVRLGGPSQVDEHLVAADELTATEAASVELALSASVVRLAAHASDGGRIEGAAAEYAHALLQQLSGQQRAAHPEFAALIAMFAALGVASSDSEQAAVSALDDALAVWAALPDFASGSNHLALRCMNVLAVLHAAGGHLRDAQNLASTVHRLTGGARSRRESDLFGVRLAMAWIRAGKCEYGSAGRWATRARAILKQHPDELLAPLLAVVEVRLLCEMGRVSDARRLLAEAEHSSMPQSWVHQRVLIETAEIHALLRNATTAPGALDGSADESNAPHVDLRLRIAAMSRHTSTDVTMADESRLDPQTQPNALLAQARDYSMPGNVPTAGISTLRAGQVAVRRPLVVSAGGVRNPATVRPAYEHGEPTEALAVPAGAGESRAGLSRTATGPIEQLTSRETEVLQYLAEFYSTREIAAAMFVSINTVRTHVRQILRKLDAPRRNLAVRRASDLGLI